MSSTGNKPPKITEAEVDEYLAESAKLEEAKRALKPQTDKVNQLYDRLHDAMVAAGIESKKVGKHRLFLLKKSKPVQWKQALVSRVSSEELASIQAAAGEKTELDIKPA